MAIDTKRKRKISRRAFLKGTLAGVVSMSAFSSFLGCQNLRDGIFSEDTARENIKKLVRAGFSVDEQTIGIEGLEKEYHFVFINDLHILIPNEEVCEESMDEAMERYEDGFLNADGVKSSELWGPMVDALNTLDLDAVILGGDMIDYFSQANLSCLREGCERLSAPFLYVRADHDYSDVFWPGLSEETVQEAEKTIDSNAEIFHMDFEEFRVVGISNSTSQITDDGLSELKRLLGEKKPVVLMIHVPFDSLVDESLRQASREAWGDRVLLWGYEDTLYQTTDNVREMLDMLYAPDSPVKAVYGGHLHFAHDGMLTDTVTQHVFDASFKGTVGHITVRGV